MGDRLLFIMLPLFALYVPCSREAGDGEGEFLSLVGNGRYGVFRVKVASR